MVHDEERHAEDGGILLVPPQVRDGDSGDPLQVAEDLVLQGEVGFKEQGVLGGVDAHHELVVGDLAILRPPGRHEDGLVGEPVGPWSGDPDDARVGIGAEPSGEPCGEDGGEVVGVSLGEFRHGRDTTHPR